MTDWLTYEKLCFYVHYLKITWQLLSNTFHSFEFHSRLHMGLSGTPSELFTRKNWSITLKSMLFLRVFSARLGFFLIYTVICNLYLLISHCFHLKKLCLYIFSRYCSSTEAAEILDLFKALIRCLLCLTPGPPGQVLL